MTDRDSLDLSDVLVGDIFSHTFPYRKALAKALLSGRDLDIKDRHFTEIQVEPETFSVGKDHIRIEGLITDKRINN